MGLRYPFAAVVGLPNFSSLLWRARNPNLNQCSGWDETGFWLIVHEPRALLCLSACESRIAKLGGGGAPAPWYKLRPGTSSGHDEAGWEVVNHPSRTFLQVKLWNWCQQLALLLFIFYVAAGCQQSGSGRLRKDWLVHSSSAPRTPKQPWTELTWPAGTTSPWPHVSSSSSTTHLEIGRESLGRVLGFTRLSSKPQAKDNLRVPLPGSLESFPRDSPHCWRLRPICWVRDAIIRARNSRAEMRERGRLGSGPSAIEMAGRRRSSALGGAPAKLPARDHFGPTSGCHSSGDLGRSCRGTWRWTGGPEHGYFGGASQFRGRQLGGSGDGGVCDEHQPAAGEKASANSSTCVGLLGGRSATQLRGVERRGGGMAGKRRGSLDPPPAGGARCNPGAAQGDPGSHGSTLPGSGRKGASASTAKAAGQPLPGPSQPGHATDRMEDLLGGMREQVGPPPTSWRRTGQNGRSGSGPDRSRDGICRRSSQGGLGQAGAGEQVQEVKATARTLVMGPAPRRRRLGGAPRAVVAEASKRWNA